MAKEMTQEEEAAFAAMQDEIQTAPVSDADETANETADASAETGEQPAGKDKQEEQRKTVPHGAFHEERERRKAAEAEIAKLREERARFDERLKVIQELQRPKEEEPDLGPDPETDPVGAINWLRQQRAQGAELMRRQQVEHEEAQRQQAVRTHLIETYQADANQFRQTNPDFGDAYQHLLTSRQQELAAIGYTPAEIHAAIQEDELAIAHRALTNGKSPSEVIYRLAKQRGYAKKASAADAGDKIERIADGQERGKSLGAIGGGVAPTEMTAERLLKMSNAEFDEWTSKHPAQAKRLMGA
jgi:hypothetical protein